MTMLSVFFIALGLSMDACAVSFAKGITLRKNVIRYGVISVSYTHLTLPTKA
mgnify:CR=1 FL=1